MEDNMLWYAEVSFITDNSVPEGRFYEEYLWAPTLHDINLQLHDAEMLGNLILHLLHIAVKRIKNMGIYEISRGDVLEGDISGLVPLQMIP